MGTERGPGEPPQPVASETSTRKADHLRLALSGDVASQLTTGLENVRVRARALPERNLAAVDLSFDLWGRRLAAPLLISCMTGGVTAAGQVNRALAAAAQAHRVAVGLGSGRILIEDPATLASFQVRDVAPDVLLLANLGAVQLATYTPVDCARLVAACEADALVVHLNPVQEAVQRGGDTAFAGVWRRIAQLCREIDVPVVVKEVGFGLAPADVSALIDAGVAGVDVAGAGGTNWARVEGLRDSRAGAVASAFRDWGWPTADALRNARAVLDAAPGLAQGPLGRAGGVVLVGSGGLSNGVDALKVLCLGADLAGIARGLLEAGARGPSVAVENVGVIVEQLRVGAWAAGAASVTDLGPELLA